MQTKRIFLGFILTFLLIFTAIFLTVISHQKRNNAQEKDSLEKADEWVYRWYKSNNQKPEPSRIGAPTVNMPFLDMIVTNNRPLLSINNASGGIGEVTYTYQIDRVPTFQSAALIEYKGVREKDEYITEKRIETDDALEDRERYYFRVRAVDSKGNKSPWVVIRFRLDTSYDDTFMNLTRIPVERVEASSGPNPRNVVNCDYSSDASFWAASPPCKEPWVKFDLGQKTIVSRIWQICDKSKPDGWLKDFVWQASSDGKKWIDIPNTTVKNNDTYINTIDFKPIAARYLRISVKKWVGYAPRIFGVMFYSPGMPNIPKVPDEDYVLVVGNASDGSTWTKLAQFIENCGLKWSS